MTTTERILDNLATYAASKKIFNESMEELPERTRSILVMRFALDGKESRTLEQCGRKYRITRERVRQIEKLGLQQLRAKLNFKIKMENL